MKGVKMRRHHQLTSAKGLNIAPVFRRAHLQRMPTNEHRLPLIVLSFTSHYRIGSHLSSEHFVLFKCVDIVL